MSENGPWATATVPVARLEFFEPSYAAKVNVSVPTNPASGKYVATLLLKPTEPWAGCAMTRAVAPAPVTGRVKASTWLFSVLVERLAAVGAAAVFALSWKGPLWQL